MCKGWACAVFYDEEVTMIIKHKFNNHNINNNTEKLLIGTFNPDVQGNEAVFFYGRNKNLLWSLLPKVFGGKSLKDKANNDKFDFIKKHKIDFVDLIEEIEIESGQENNYADVYIDQKVKKWKNIIDILEKNKNIKEVYFTRKSFSNIPNLKSKIKEIEVYCLKNQIKLNYLLTPARFENDEKLNQWKKAFGK